MMLGTYQRIVYSTIIVENTLQNQLAVESTGVQARRYAFALSEEANQLEAISAQVIQEQDDADWLPLLNRFLPEK